MMCYDIVTEKSEVEELLFTATAEGKKKKKKIFPISLLGKVPCTAQFKESSAFAFALILVSNSDLKYSCNLGMKILETA